MSSPSSAPSPSGATATPPAALQSVVAPLTVIAFGAEGVEEAASFPIENVRVLLGRSRLVWLHLGTADRPTLEKLGDAFGLHPLSIEDVENVAERPKLDLHDAYLHLVLKAHATEVGLLRADHVNILFGEGWVLSVEQRPSGRFARVRERLLRPEANFAGRGADWLAYLLADAIVDATLASLTRVAADLEALEDAILRSPDFATRERAQDMNRSLRRATLELLAQRDALVKLRRLDRRLEPETLVGLDDVLDHATAGAELAGALRDEASDLRELYLGEQNARLSEVVKFLTVLSTIFIPLTFLASIYGMNFRTMPELDAPWGYPVVLGVMALIAGLMVLTFRRKGWI